HRLRSTITCLKPLPDHIRGCRRATKPWHRQAPPVGTAHTGAVALNRPATLSAALLHLRKRSSLDYGRRIAQRRAPDVIAAASLLTGIVIGLVLQAAALAAAHWRQLAPLDSID